MSFFFFPSSFPPLLLPCTLPPPLTTLQLTFFFSRYITHYSYFGGFRSSVSNVGPNSALLTQKGELTDMGAWYLGEAATGNVPKGDASTRGVAGSRFTGSVLLVIVAAVWCMG